MNQNVIKKWKWVGPALSALIALIGTAHAEGKYRSDQEEAVAYAVWLEARDQAFIGQLAVVDTIYNRVRCSAYPDTPQEVLGQPWQFATTYPDRLPLEVAKKSPSWPSAAAAASKYGFGLSHLDSTHFYAPRSMDPKDSAPDWASKLEYLTTVGDHLFYRSPRCQPNEI